MALSTYFNWDTLQTLKPEMSSTATFHEPPHHFSAYNSDESFYLPNTVFDSYFDPTSLLYPEIYPHLFSCTSPHHDTLITLSDIFPTHHEDYNHLLPCPKRQKLELAPPNYCFDGFVPNLCSLPAEELPEIFPVMAAPPEFEVALPQGTYCGGSNVVDDQSERRSCNNEKMVSAQSIAARERRRKITEKTQELGRLVPGGSKMNTAEMLHAAAKYVKCLQAQVDVLELMGKLQEEKASTPTEDLQALLVSPSVQEKLYLEEKCVVPEEFVTTLTNHHDVQSRPSILKDLHQLIATDIEKKPQKE